MAGEAPDMKKEINLGVVTFKKSGCQGSGLIANEDIGKGEFIHITQIWLKEQNHWGDVMPNCMYNHSKKNENSEIKTLGLIFSEKGEPISINKPFIEVGITPPHGYEDSSDEYSVSWGGKSLYTSKEIKAGEEIFVDYTKDKDLEQPRGGWKE